MKNIAILGLFSLGIVTLAFAQKPQQESGSATPTTRVRSSQPRPKENPTPPLPENSPVRPAVEKFRAGHYTEAAQLLAALDPAKLPATEARRWRLTAQSVAVRAGDRELLRRANSDREGLVFADGRQILHAWELAQVGQYALAKATVKKVSDPERLDERSRRRYLALLAGIAAQEKDVKTEREMLTKLVEYMGSWKSDTCQSCHENPEKYGDDVTSLDVANHWIGKRYSALLQGTGTAAKTRQEAEKRLASFADDEGARLHLAYALRATGQEKEAEVEFRKLEWAAFPDRPYKVPDNNLIFPGPLPLEKPRPVSAFMPENHIVSAADYLRANEFDRAHAELKAGAAYKNPSLATRYRSFAIQARLARLEQNDKAERKALRGILQLLTETRPATDKVWTPPQDWWVLQRLVALGEQDSANRLRSLSVPLSKDGPEERDLQHYP